MLNYDDIRQRINEITEIGDSVKASAKILELNDIITNSNAEDVQRETEFTERISALENENTSLRNEVEDIRKANADVMLKYGELLTHQTNNYIKSKKEEGEDIVNME